MQEVSKLSYMWLFGGLVLLLLLVFQLQRVGDSCSEDDELDLSSKIKSLDTLLDGLLKEIEAIFKSNDCSTFVESVAHPDGRSKTDPKPHRRGSVKAQ